MSTETPARTQRQDVRCGRCDLPFAVDMPVGVPVSEAVAAMLAVTCPGCGQSAKSGKGIMLGQGRSRAEDRSFEWGDTYDERVRAWIDHGESGTSSKGILERMTGRVRPGDCPVPSDTSDLRRCVLLLDRVPEWRGRIGEMANVSPEWRRLSGRWEEVVKSFEDETGPGLERVPAPRTGALLREILAA